MKRVIFIVLLSIFGWLPSLGFFVRFIGWREPILASSVYLDCLYKGGLTMLSISATIILIICVVGLWQCEKYMRSMEKDGEND